MAGTKSYEDFGLVNTRDMLKKALEGGYAIPAYNFNNMEQLEAIIGCMETKSPVILQCSGSARKYVNRFGGKMDAAVGIPEEQLRQAARSAVCKINIDSDGRLAMTATIWKIFSEKPGEFDPRKYLGPARDAVIHMVKHKNEHVLGSAGKA